MISIAIFMLVTEYTDQSTRKGDDTDEVMDE
jgi:hypothetical protein